MSGEEKTKSCEERASEELMNGRALSRESEEEGAVKIASHTPDTSDKRPFYFAYVCTHVCECS